MVKKLQVIINEGAFFEVPEERINTIKEAVRQFKTAVPEIIIRIVETEEEEF